MTRLLRREADMYLFLFRQRRVIRDQNRRDLKNVRGTR